MKKFHNKLLLLVAAISMVSLVPAAIADSGLPSAAYQQDDYKITLQNNSSRTVEVTRWVQGERQSDLKVSPHATGQTTLNKYTAYDLIYESSVEGGFPQGIGTLQKYTDIVYQIVPQQIVDMNARITLQPTNNGKTTLGWVDNKINSQTGNYAFDGAVCQEDTPSGVTCYLSKPQQNQNLTSLTLTIGEW